MKRAITIKLVVVVLVGMLAVLLTDYRLQIRSAQAGMVQNAQLRIDQIQQLLEQNNAEIERLKENLKEDYIIRAKAAAYIVENRPEIEHDVEELKKVAALLQVDELHLFDAGGAIYSGTEPRYYGYSFASGTQMGYFFPLLEDKSLEMSQDVTPNTAEGKLMQYTALWREDGSGIVQIGMEPVRLMQALKKNELSYLFANMTVDPGITLYAVDGDTGEVAGCTDPALAGGTAGALGLDLDGMVPAEGGFSASVNGVESHCFFQRQVDGTWLGVSCTNKTLLQNLPRDMAFAAFSLIAISAIMIFFLLVHIDRHIIRGINTVIAKLTRITNGDLDTRVEVDSSPEFSALSRHINGMVHSLLESTNKLSLVFQSVEVPIAVYEYNPDMARVQATSRLADILGLSPGDMALLLADRALFRRRIDGILSRPLETRPDGDVYLLAGSEPRYLKYRTYLDGKSTFGVVIDITEDERERQRITRERDVDLLTGLATRRAFFRRMDALCQDPAALGYTALLMADADRLKQINDTHGHEYGDRFLQAVGGLLKDTPAPQKLAARLSGDEFVLFLYGCAGEEEVLRILGALETRMQTRELPLPGGGYFPVRLSGGYVISPPGFGDYRAQLRLADQALYEVKRGMRGRFAPYTP